MNWIEENKKKFFYIGIVILLCILVVSVTFIIQYFTVNEVKEISYNDEEKLDYKVTLKDNEYYTTDSIEKDNQYIASIIDKIQANFKYDLIIENQIEYDYTYNIIGNVEVIDSKTNKIIYTNSEKIIEEKTGHSIGNMNIDENVEVVYENYNNLMTQFITVYDLSNVTAKLQLSLTMGIKGTSEEFEIPQKNLMNLDIPLATNTISIDINYEPIMINNKMVIENQETNGQNYFGIGIIFLIVDVVLLIVFIIILKKSETEEEKYKKELRKIVTNYDSCISRVEDDFDMKGYKILKVASFIDLLEIRDIMRLPIIMLENKENLISYFFIATVDKILYFYSIGVKQYTLTAGKHASTSIENEYEKDETIDDKNSIFNQETIDDKNIISNQETINDKNIIFNEEINKEENIDAEEKNHENDYIQKT